MIDRLTFYLAYWILHTPVYFSSILVNRLSLILYWLAILPLRPWFKQINAANVNKRGGK